MFVFFGLCVVYSQMDMDNALNSRDVNKRKFIAVLILVHKYVRLQLIYQKIQFFEHLF